jgi:hypothetical protein
MDLITESSVEGECEGFDGDRVFELVNGQKNRKAGRLQVQIPLSIPAFRSDLARRKR